MSITEASKWKLKKKAAYVEGFYSILFNTMLFFFKYYFGTLFNSIAVTADSFHSLSDSLTSIVLVVGYKIADKPPDKEHPYGHGRAEFVIALVIGVFLGVVAYDYVIKSYEKLVSGEAFEFSLTLLLVLWFSLIVKLGLTLWAYNLGNKYHSQPIKADAWHHASDAIASGLLVLAMYLGRDCWWIDGVLGIVVSLLIFATAAKILYDASNELLGRAPAKREFDKLLAIIRESYLGEVHHVHFHKYGKHIEVTLHIHLPGCMTLREAHEVATRIENKIRERLGYEATVHIEPFELDEAHVD